MGNQRSYFRSVRSAIKENGHTEIRESILLFGEISDAQIQLDAGTGDAHQRHDPDLEWQEKGPQTGDFSTERQENRYGEEPSFTEILEQLSRQQNREKYTANRGKQHSESGSNRFNGESRETKRRAYYNRYICDYYAPKGDWLDFKI